MSGIVILGRSARACAGAIIFSSSNGGSSCPTLGNPWPAPTPSTAPPLSPAGTLGGSNTAGSVAAVVAATATVTAAAGVGGLPEAGGGIGTVPAAGGGIDRASSRRVKEKDDCRSGGSRWTSFDFRSHSSLRAAVFFWGRIDEVQQQRQDVCKYK